MLKGEEFCFDLAHWSGDYSSMPYYVLNLFVGVFPCSLKALSVLWSTFKNYCLASWSIIFLSSSVLRLLLLWAAIFDELRRRSLTGVILCDTVRPRFGRWNLLPLVSSKWSSSGLLVLRFAWVSCWLSIWLLFEGLIMIPFLLLWEISIEAFLWLKFVLPPPFYLFEGEVTLVFFIIVAARSLFEDL